MDKRYQVFLSSTYLDLKDERLEVMRALLELDCIPSGMEYFPAANDDQWSFIKELIDQCDYYIVVIGARYGSTSSGGLSFTEKEYRYALEKGIPVIGFVHSQPELIPQGRAESDPDARKKLDGFKKLVRSKLCKEWSTPAELGAVVSRSLTQLIKRNPRPGWVRSDNLASSEAKEEILRLHRLLETKDEEIGRLYVAQKADIEGFAQGSDQVELAFQVSLTNPALPYSERTSKFASTCIFTWDEVFKSFALHLLTPIKISSIKSSINSLIREYEINRMQEMFLEEQVGHFTITNSSLQLVIVQFTALKFLEISNSEDREGKPFKLVELSPQGRSYLLNIIAARRGQLAKVAPTAPETDNDEE